MGFTQDFTSASTGAPDSVYWDVTNRDVGATLLVTDPGSGKVLQFLNSNLDADGEMLYSVWTVTDDFTIDVVIDYTTPDNYNLCVIGMFVADEDITRLPAYKALDDVSPKIDGFWLEFLSRGNDQLDLGMRTTEGGSLVSATNSGAYDWSANRYSAVARGGATTTVRLERSGSHSIIKIMASSIGTFQTLSDYDGVSTAPMGFFINSGNNGALASVNEIKSITGVTGTYSGLPPEQSLRRKMSNLINY